MIFCQKYNRLFYLFIVCFIALPVYLQGQDLLILDKKNLDLETINLLSYLNCRIPEAPGSVPVSSAIDQLDINQPYIFSFKVKNGTSDTIIRYLQFGNRYVTANTIAITPVNNKNYVLIPQSTNTVLIKIMPSEVKVVTFKLNELNRADPEKISVALISPQNLEKRIRQLEIMQSFFLGLFAFLFVFNLIIYFVTTWRVYLKYAVYIFFSLLYFSYYFGLLQVVFPSVNLIPVNLVYTWYSIIFILYFVFLNDFGNYRQYVPRAYKLLNIGIVFKSVETLVNTFLHLAGFSFIYSPVFVNLILGFEIVLMGFILFYIIKNKHVRGRFVIVASVLLIVGGIIEQAKIFPDIDNTYFIEFGITAELLTFSVGLGYITKLYYDEKRAAELLYIEQLVNNEKLQKEITHELEDKVRQRTSELKMEKQLVEKKNDENELLLAEIHHRVKNNLQVVSSLLSLQEKSVDDLKTKRAIHEGKERIRSMELVHKMLYRTNSYSGIEMSDYVTKLSAGLIESFGLNENEIELNCVFQTITLDVDVAIPVGLILNELIINSLKHATSNTNKLVLIIVITEKETEGLTIYLSDNGKGKIADIETSNSFGLKIIRALVRQLNGELEIKEEGGIHYSIALKNYKPTLLT
jgi:two-component sensor histidine kinase